MIKKITYIHNPNREDEKIDFLCEHFNDNAVQKYDVLSTHFENQPPTYAITYKNPIDYIAYVDKAFPIAYSELKFMDTGNANLDIFLACTSSNQDDMRMFEKIRVGKDNE